MAEEAKSGTGQPDPKKADSTDAPKPGVTPTQAGEKAGGVAGGPQAIATQQAAAKEATGEMPEHPGKAVLTNPPMPPLDPEGQKSQDITNPPSPLPPVTAEDVARMIKEAQENQLVGPAQIPTPGEAHMDALRHSDPETALAAAGTAVYDYPLAQHRARGGRGVAAASSSRVIKLPVIGGQIDTLGVEVEAAETVLNYRDVAKVRVTGPSESLGELQERSREYFNRVWEGR